MMSGWESSRAKLLRNARISAEKKLEGLRLMNETADKILKKHQKIARRKLRTV